MSLFDLPRINFSGNIDVNVPTVNNAYYFPLTIYDATRARAFLPPRLYFTTKAIVESVHSSINPAVYEDPDNGYVYIEIEPINTIEILREWCMKPLGTDSNAPDAAYLPYYTEADKNLAGKKYENTPIIGVCPGYWNLYGDMSVTMSDVNVTGVQTLGTNEIKTWTLGSQNIPPDVLPFLNCGFNLNTSPSSGISTANMVETISSQSVYANVFCSNVNLFNKNNPDQVYLQGKPFRFSAMIYSAWRVLNWRPPMSGSARFCSAIPMEEINQSDQSALIAFFNRYKPDPRPLKGVVVSFTILEVFENRFNQNYYEEFGTKPNPAQGTTFGSITPWYEDDMKSVLIGRNLISLNMAPVYSNNGNNITLTPAVASMKVLSSNSAIFTVDMGNTLPEKIFTNVKNPSHRGEASFETYPLGRMSIRYATDPSTEFASIVASPNPIGTDPDANPRSKVFAMGGIYDFYLSDPYLISLIQSNLIQVYLDGNHVLTEAPYMITTDQKGLYCNQGDQRSEGYIVYSEQREPCVLRIFQYGRPVTSEIPIGIVEYLIPEAGNDPMYGPNSINWVSLKDNMAVQLGDPELEPANNAVYYFVYNNQYLNNQIPKFSNPGYTVMDTGSFVCLRVLPTKDYSQYTNPDNWDTSPPTFEILYEEVLKMYDVVYPAMALKYPFKKEVWNNGTMAGQMVNRTDPKIWNNIIYMPRSRELSSSQRALILAWAQYFNQNKNQGNE